MHKCMGNPASKENQRLVASEPGILNFLTVALGPPKEPQST